MDSSKKELIEKIGVDVDAMMERFMNNEELYLRFLYKIIDNEEITALQKAVEDDDMKEALEISHKLKSLTGNLSLMKLHELFSDQVKDIREDKWDEAVSMMDGIMKEYERVVTLIKESDRD